MIKISIPAYRAGGRLHLQNPEEFQEIIFLDVEPGRVARQNAVGELLLFHAL